MKHRTHYRRLAVFLMLLTPLIVKGQQPSASSEVTAMAPAHALAGLLPDRLAGFTAASEVTQVGGDRLADIVPDRARAFQEYRVSAAASRYYGSIRVDLFQTQNQFTAFGLFTYSSGKDKGVDQEVGSGGALVDGATIFWKENYFVRVVPSEPARARPSATVALARAVANVIGPQGVAVLRPPLLE
ncbi:MAG TPA: DUF6599 family protein, partial [Blastocatellia bacterium]|nr:DUF6599 family protein [Blastocatellia bacterium]